MITGDDILIEYVARLMSAIRSIAQNMLKAQWIYQIEKFIKHSVWHSSDVRRAQNNKLWQRLESRLIEMKERRKRLLQSLYKKELKLFQEAQGFSANRQKQQEELEQFQKENKFREE
jgi:methyl coenzyme M reductase subunit D